MLANHDSRFCETCTSFEGVGIEDEVYASCTLCAVAGGKRCVSCDQLRELYEKIRETSKLLCHLLCSAFDLQSQRNRQHDLLMNRLPTELLARIFMQLLPPDPAPPASTFFPLLTLEANAARVEVAKWSHRSLSAVCRAWRDVVRSTPQMWTSIAVNVEQNDASYAEFINDQFLRSGGLPISLKVYEPHHRFLNIVVPLEPGPTTHCKRLFEIINAHSSRWKRLDTQLRPVMLQFLCGQPETNSSMLQHLRLERYSYFNRNAVPAHFAMKHSMPSPRTVYIEGMPLDAISICWDNVTHLELCSFDSNCCLALFRTAQAMSHLTLKHFRIERWESFPLIEHTSLRALKICNSWIDPLLDSLSLPSLEEIFVDDLPSSTLTLTNLIIRSGCHLKRLTVMMDAESEMPDHTENELIHLLEHTPSLLALILETPPVTDTFFRRLGPVLHDSAYNDTNRQEFLPLLHTLIIRVFINFEWNSVTHMFFPFAGSPDSARRALKVFELKIFGDGGDSASRRDFKSFVIDDDTMKRLLAVRDSGVYASILDYRDREALVANNKKNDVHFKSILLGAG